MNLRNKLAAMAVMSALGALCLPRGRADDPRRESG